MSFIKFGKTDLSDTAALSQNCENKRIEQKEKNMDKCKKKLCKTR